MASAAMNEQGFLFAQKVQESLQYPSPGKVSPPEWEYIDREYPVTASDGSQTRVDLVFRNARHPGVHACIECKRADPLYKRWVYFNEDRISQYGTLHFEIIQLTQIGPVDLPMKYHGNHLIRHRPSVLLCPVFNSYLEVAIERNQRAGYTETVETAFLQIIKGHTGMMAKLLSFKERLFLCSIPIVVTTAELFRARFHTGNVDLKTGKLEPKDLTVEQMDFCAVNYHPNDELSLKSEHARSSRTNVRQDIDSWQARTIFVVRGDKVENFLSWLNSAIPTGQG